MDKAKISHWLLGVLLLGCWMAGAPVAEAHNGPPRITLGAEWAAPGVALEIRGINIAPEQQVTLTLAGRDADYSFGSVMGDDHGDFTEIVTIPREAIAGAYIVRAFGANRVIVSAPLVIRGVAAEEESEQRDQDEPLLAPMPQSQLSQSAQPQQPIAQPAQPAAGAVLAPATPAVALWYGLAAFAALLAAGGIAFAWRRRVVRTGEVSR